MQYPKKRSPQGLRFFCFRRASEGGQASFVLLFLHLRLPSQAFGLAPADLFGRDALDFRQLLLRQFHCPALFACTKPLFAQMTVVEALLGRLVVVFVNRSEEIGNSLGHVQIVGDPQDDLRGDTGVSIFKVADVLAVLAERATQFSLTYSQFLSQCAQEDAEAAEAVIEVS